MTHTIEQPGLHAHSWSPEFDLMKRWVLYKKTPSGWLAVRSFDSKAALLRFLVTDTGLEMFPDGFKDNMKIEDSLANN